MAFKTINGRKVNLNNNSKRSSSSIASSNGIELPKSIKEIGEVGFQEHFAREQSKRSFELQQENRVKKINKLADRIKNPQNYKGFDPNNPFKDHDRLRKQMVEIQRIHSDLS